MAVRPYGRCSRTTVRSCRPRALRPRFRAAFSSVASGVWPWAGTGRQAGDESTEAILDGDLYGLSDIVYVTADDVVIDGLEIRGGSGDLLQSPDGVPVARTLAEAESFVRSNIGVGSI